MRIFLSRNRADRRCIDAGVVWGPRHWSESDHYAVVTGRPSTLIGALLALGALMIAIGAMG
jgi:hypothetical protein